MTYKEWAGKYYDSAQGVKDRLEETRRKLKTAVGEEAVLLTARIRVLTQMYYDCMDTYHLLVVREGDVD